MDTFTYLSQITFNISSFFTRFFDIIFSNVWELLADSNMPSWLLESLDTLQLDVYLSNFSIISLLFSTLIIAILIVKFFIP